VSPESRPLQPRLAAIQALAGRTARLTDVGAHDAAVTLALVGSGSVERALAIDRSGASCARAREQVGRSGLSVEVRRGTGLEPVTDAECGGVLLMSGVGGATIVHMLETPRADRFERWVLSPQSETAIVRRAIAGQGRRIVAESMVEDAGRIYVILAADRGEEPLDAADLLLGPRLRRDPTPLVLRWFASEASRLERAIARASSDRRALLEAELALFRANKR
jgi:tRNA (adenine22-N1)-methyltransferase